MFEILALLLAPQSITLDDLTVKEGDAPQVIVSKVIKGYDLCLFSNARRYALSTSETAPVIVDSTFGSCSSWDSTYRNSIVLFIPSLPPSQVDDQIDRYKLTRRPQLLAYVLDVRIKKRAGRKR